MAHGAALERHIVTVPSLKSDGHHRAPLCACALLRVDVLVLPLDLRTICTGLVRYFGATRGPEMVQVQTPPTLTLVIALDPGLTGHLH